MGMGYRIEHAEEIDLSLTTESTVLATKDFFKISGSTSIAIRPPHFKYELFHPSLAPNTTFTLLMRSHRNCAKHTKRIISYLIDARHTADSPLSYLISCSL